MPVILDQDSRAVMQPAECQDHDDMFPLIQQQQMIKSLPEKLWPMRMNCSTGHIHSACIIIM